MTSLLSDSGRSSVVAALRRELFGPPDPEELDADESAQRPSGTPIQLDPPPTFELAQDAYGPFHEAGTGNEVLVRDRPVKRYGVGVLYPAAQVLVDANEGEAGDTALDVAVNADAPAPVLNGLPEVTGGAARDDGDDFDLSSANQFRPSAMAVSFLAELEPGGYLEVAGSGARYEEVKVKVAGRERSWFARRPLVFTVRFDAPTRSGRQVPVVPADTEPIELRVDLVARERSDGRWLITAALVNTAPSSRSADTASLFQAGFTVTPFREDGEPARSIVPYPDAASERLLARDSESRSLDLLYSNAPTFGVGHGCAATWDERWGEHRAASVHATALPQFETPSVTPDVTLSDGTRVEVPMAPLAGLDPANDGFESLRFVADAYGRWIQELEEKANDLTGFRRQAAEDHLGKCRRAYERIDDGITWLLANPDALKAFRLANRAVLNQQLHYRSAARTTTLQKDGRAVVEAGVRTKTWQEANRCWRAFQIGFLLASARSAVEGEDADRDTVELIFFPTGGGKTEAYLGLSAFCLFYQRLKGKNTGVSVLMRYTLRLLTTQQFLRAAALVCAMEIIRDEEAIGGQPFTIGIWVGGTTTPNTRAQAKTAFNSISRGHGTNPFLLLRCPWCAAQMGKVETVSGYGRHLPKIAGYRPTSDSVEFICPDRSCRFSRGIPAVVIDEDVYQVRPSIVIATVDKFAMLAFTPAARTLFGLGPEGERELDPPNLIIQDELHLIAGPLGSMVGIYEPIIEELCTAANGVKPKIVGSTATIRNYEEQIRGLYGRTEVCLFPPHGLDASDSFFAQHARDPATGKLVQGKMYVGVHAPGLGSIQTAQVRAGAALFQAPLQLPGEQRDPWWTSMMFFNSLRELGTSVSLLQSDIPDYLFAMKLRDGHTEQRFINQLMELTSRMSQDEVPEAIAKLEREWSSGKAIDTCLASSIIEVGVDIPRLSLLTVLGQPKTTSQYIQITGRVGRNWQERPGLVVMIYSASRPRDRSHFERFQSYHQRLYAEVEPVSVTPFCAPVLERASHAASVVYARQTGARGLGPDPAGVAIELFDKGGELLAKRAATSDPEAVADVKAWAARRHTEWAGWEPVMWETRTGDDDGPLMRRAGEWVDPDLRSVTWPVPMSMRDVDAECRCAVTNRYAVARGEQTEDPDS